MSDSKLVESDQMATVYQGRVAKEDGELVLVFPASMLLDLGWQEGDSVVWDIRPDAVVVKKVND
jgi:hypothetical protein